jgi:hypothetical protein
VADGKSWDEVRGQRALNEVRVETYGRLMDAQSDIAELLLRLGLATEAQLDQAVAASQADDSGSADEDGVYMSALRRYVSALGGHLEITAVFPDASVTVGRARPGDDGTST